MMTWHQIAARLLFAAGLVLIWFVMGPAGFAGAGLFFLFVIIARQVEANGRQRRIEQERSHQAPQRSQLRD